MESEEWNGRKEGRKEGMEWMDGWTMDGEGMD